MPNVLWSESFEGESGGVMLEGDRILMHYTPDRTRSSGRKGISELLCYDLGGRQLWRRSNLRGLLSLGANHFLVVDGGGIARILGGDGCELARWKGDAGIERAARHDDLLALAAGRTVYVTDLELQPIGRLEWPRRSNVSIDCFVDGAFRWVEGDELRAQDLSGRRWRFGSVPLQLADETMSDFERITGHSALQGGFVEIPADESDWAPYIEGKKGNWKYYNVGDRPDEYRWHIAFDQEEGVFFLANSLPPHLLICLDRQGHAKWCRYLSPSCCGGVGYGLPSGLFVASSGCGGVMTWFDVNGLIFFRSDLREHSGWRIYHNQITVLSDGSSLIWSGCGLLAYDSRGELVWVIKPGYHQFDVNEDRGVLAGCHWKSGEAERKTAVLEAVDYRTGV